MEIKTLKDRVKTANTVTDVNYFLQTIEEYLSFHDIDMWNIKRRMEELEEMETMRENYNFLTQLAQTDNIYKLQAIVANGLLFKEAHENKVEELNQIKTELRDLYLKLLKSLA